MEIHTVDAYRLLSQSASGQLLLRRRAVARALGLRVADLFSLPGFSPVVMRMLCLACPVRWQSCR